MASFTATAVSGKLDSNQSDFLWYFDLSNAPASFWSDVDALGATVRVFDGGTRLPCHVASLNPTDETGWLVFKADGLTGSDNEFTIDTAGSAFSPGADQSFATTNGGAETGNTTGWTNQTGSLGIRTTEDQGPYAGAYYFDGGNNALTVAYQNYDVSSLSTEIDAGEYAAYIEWQHNAAGADYGQIYFTFLNSGASQIGGIHGAGLIAGGGAWFARALHVPIPAGTETVRVHIHCYRTAGTRNNAYFDAIGDLKLRSIDPYGPERCWSDFAEVLPLVGSPDGALRNTRVGGALRLEASLAVDGAALFEQTAVSANLGVHQGVCSDGIYIYVSDTNALKKYNLAMDTLLATNADPLGDLTGPNLDHLGDIEYHNGKIYAPCIEQSGQTEQTIGVFDADDLSFIEEFDVSAQGHDMSGIAYRDVDGFLYVTGNVAQNKMFKYDPTDGSYQGDLDLSLGIPGFQGATWWHGAWWLQSSDNDETYRCTADGEVTNGGVFEVGSVTYEGIGKLGDSLLVLTDTTGDAGNGVVRTFKPVDVAMSLGGGAVFDGVPVSNLQVRVPSLQTFTLGLTVTMANKSAKRTPLSYNDESGNNRRVNVTMDDTPTTEFYLWENNGSTALFSNLDPTLNQAYRIHATVDGSTEQTIQWNASNKQTDTTGLSVPFPTLQTLRIGNEDTTQTEQHQGRVAFVYLYPGVLSDDWIAGEYDQLSDNATFWSVVEVETPPATPTVTIVQEREAAVDAATSAFSAGEGGSHTHTQWQITTAADTGFASPVYNPGDDASNLEAITNAGLSVPLTGGTDYLIRARHKEDDTTYSAWSTAVAFSTTGNSSIRYVPVIGGDVLVFAGSFVKENGLSDDTSVAIQLVYFDAAKQNPFIPFPDPVLLEAAANSGRFQISQAVPTLAGGGVGNYTRYVNIRAIPAIAADSAVTLGIDWLCGWRNPPPFGLTGFLTLDGSNVDLEWETAILAKVKYVANTTGFVSLATVDAGGTFTSASELTTDTEADVLTSLGTGVTGYVTLVPYDESDRRSGPRLFLSVVGP